MEIKRDRYLEGLKVRRHNGMIKVITGIRRCGKSYLVFHLFKNYLLANDVEYINVYDFLLKDNSLDL